LRTVVISETRLVDCAAGKLKRMEIAREALPDELLVNPSHCSLSIEHRSSRGTRETGPVARGRARSTHRASRPPAEGRLGSDVLCPCPYTTFPHAPVKPKGPPCAANVAGLGFFPPFLELVSAEVAYQHGLLETRRGDSSIPLAPRTTVAGSWARGPLLRRARCRRPATPSVCFGPEGAPKTLDPDDRSLVTRRFSARQLRQRAGFLSAANLVRGRPASRKGEPTAESDV